MSSSNQAAVVSEAKARITLQDRPIPKPGPREILIRNHAVAINPVDWKIQDYTFYVTEYPNVLGSDAAGVVEAVGDQVRGFKKGDRVIGYAGVIWTNRIEEGAFQTYLLLKDIATAHVPKTLSFEDASIFPMAVATVAAGFFLSFGIPVPKESQQLTPTAYKGQVLVVYGASSSVGITAIQMGKQLGFTVVGIAGSRNKNLVLSAGAHYFVDRSQTNLTQAAVATIKETGGHLTHAFDSISAENSFKILSDIITSAAKSNITGKEKVKLSIVLGWPEDLPQPDSLIVTPITAFDIFTKSPEVGRWTFNTYLSNQLKTASLKALPPVRIVDGGLSATQKAWDESKAGVSGEKLVIQIQ